MGHVNKGDAHGLLNALQFVLHVLAEPQIQSAQGLVQQKDLGAVDQGTGDGYPLLLSAGQRRDLAVFKALETDNVQHLHNPLVDLPFAEFGQPKAKGDVVVDVQMGKQSVTLEYGIDFSLVGRQLVDALAVEEDFAGGRR